MARRIAYEYRRPGKPSTTYDEWLVIDRPDVKVLLLDRYAGPPVAIEEAVVQDLGAPIIWYVFPERWYDIGRFHLLDGTATGWYTNLCRPPILEGERWIGSDLFLDLWQPATGGHVWLDEDELDAAARAGVLDRAILRRIGNERAMIQLLVGEGVWPPPIARDVDLAQVRTLLDG